MERDSQTTIAIHPALSNLSSALILTTAINSFSENSSDIETALKVATDLTNFATVPPGVETSLFWKCISTGVAVSQTLTCAEGNYHHELECLFNKLHELLVEAVFIRPEEVALKCCIEEVGPQIATSVNSHTFCHDLLVQLLNSVCVIAKFERKSTGNSFNRNAVNLIKSIIQLNFPDPVDETLGKIISNALPSSFDEFSSLLPLILLTCVNETPLNLKSILGIFIPVVEFLSSVSVTVENREAVDALCWQILKKVIAKPDEISENQANLDTFFKAIINFFASQRVTVTEPYLRYILPFCISNHSEGSLSVLLKSFLSAGRADMMLKLLLEHANADAEENHKWLVPFIGSWLKVNFSLTTSSFPSVWRFLLAKCFDAENSLVDNTALWCFNDFLSGFQAFGSQENILPSVRADFASLCHDTVELLSSSKFIDTTLSDIQFAIPTLNCIASAALILTVGKVEAGELESDAKKMRKLFKRYLKKCASVTEDSSSNEHMLKANVAMCLIERKNKECTDKLECFLASKISNEALNVTSAVKFYLHDCSSQNALADSNILVSLIDTWLCGAPVNECDGQLLILAIRLLDERQCLDSYLASIDVASTKYESIVTLLSSPKCLVLISSLPHKVRSLLLELALKKLEHLSASKHKNCPIDLIAHILQREADFAAFEVFEKHCSLVVFMKMMEHHVNCDRESVAQLSKLACNSCLNDDSSFSGLVSKFLLKRLSCAKASLPVCQCLASFSRKIRTLHYKAPLQNMLASLSEESFSLSNDNLLQAENDFLCLATCLVTLLDWPKFGRDKVTLEDLVEICKIVPKLDKLERNLWSTPLIELFSKCLKSNPDYGNLVKAAQLLLSDVFSDFDLSSSVFITLWQNIFLLAGEDGGKLLRQLLFVHRDELMNYEMTSVKFSPLCSGFLKALVTSCNKEEHSEEDHESAVWLDSTMGDGSSSPCPASEMVFALYESVTAYPMIGVYCLPVASQFGFFDTHTRGLLSFDLLLAIVVSAARCSPLLAKSSELYTAYCSLLSSLLRLRVVQQENSDSSQAIRLTNILHIILFCLSSAFTAVLEFPLPQSNIAEYFQELSKLTATASYRRRMLGDAAVHIVASSLVSAVRSPLPAGFAGLPAIFRKQLIAVVVQLFQLCSERALKSMALFLPQECLPLLKSLRSEAFVQRKARRKV